MHILKSALFAASVAVLAGNVAAQCSNYANTGNAGTVVLDADEGIRTVGLPFSFPFNGLSINQMTISSNGWIKLGATTTTTSAELTDSETTLLSGNARLALLWDDLNAAVAGAGEIYYAADATQASVTFQNVPHFGSTQTAVKANCECILQPSGDIYFYYDSTCAYNLSSSSSIVGISRGNTGPALTAGTHLVDWSTASSTPINVVDATAYQLFTSTTGLSPFDLTGGVVLHFAPTGVDTYTVTTTTLTTCTPGTYPPLAGATVTSVGTGCPNITRTAIYELFTSNAGASPIDLANSSIEFVKSGNSYSTIPGPGFDPNYAVGGSILAGVGDDTATTVSLVGGLGTFQLGLNAAITSVQVISNGAIGLPTGPTTANPAAASFHTAGARAAAAWADLVPNTTTAPIYIENTASFFRATWQGVPLFTDGGSHTFQITLMPSGNIIYSYAAMSGGATKAFLTGLAGSTTAVDTGSVDLFTGGVANSVTKTVTAPAAMGHTISSAPRIGQDWTMNATVDVNNLGVGVFAVGATNPNVPLDLVYGPGSAPGCTIYNDLIETFFVLFTPGATSFTLTLPIPYNVGLTGLPLFSQAACFAPLNGAGVVTSNGRSFTTGL